MLQAWYHVLRNDLGWLVCVIHEHGLDYTMRRTPGSALNVEAASWDEALIALEVRGARWDEGGFEVAAGPLPVPLEFWDAASGRADPCGLARELGLR